MQGNSVGSPALNQEVLVFRVALDRGSPKNKGWLKEASWNGAPKRVKAPYLKIPLCSLLFYLSTLGNESPEGTIPDCRERLNTSYHR
ncbi:MAG: hypothetical protein A2564_01300 [Candidatus Wildermuthbacteria bacterium RIFOXYD1_FULL_50_12]|nr:MAG: hypothetical protein A2564_01300 [Candidatus Wildermuthbacteria bacterium RIFOXYD1_FULL_50_12]